MYNMRSFQPHYVSIPLIPLIPLIPYILMEAL